MHFLTINEVQDRLKYYVDRGFYGDKPLLITTNDSSVGGRAFVGIAGIYSGFDWELGQIRIEPNEPIVKKYNNRDVGREKWLFTERITNKKYTVCSSCHHRIGKKDKYCKHCGQKLNEEVVDKNYTC